ncbi:TetR/AcrR family transcriptional regulator [Collimonas pratensis]|uniref:TetR/AcrR family transcriptional regulator n=1 Tax=Collimonas pratensis TaxID=279113 RepID=UPI0009EDA85D|nr:TetR/AcrR family transcriptional regulator [Collimonas pratensis]
MKIGASRGAITYNFPTKRDLVVAMIDHMFEHTRSLVEQAIKMEKDVPNTILKSMVRLTADVSGRMKDFSQGLFQSAVAEEPSVIEPFSQFYGDYWAKIVEEAQDPVRALMIWTSVEGLILLDSYKPPPYTHEQRNALVELLLVEASHA